MIFVQIRNIYHMVLTKYVLAVQDNTTMLGIRVKRTIEKFLQFNEVLFGDFLHCKPICLKWM